MPHLVYAPIVALRERFKIPAHVVLYEYPEATLVDVPPELIERFRCEGLHVTTPARAPVPLVSGVTRWEDLLRMAEESPRGAEGVDMYVLRYPGPLATEHEQQLLEAAETVVAVAGPVGRIVRASKMRLAKLRFGQHPVQSRWLEPGRRIHPALARPEFLSGGGRVDVRLHSEAAAAEVAAPLAKLALAEARDPSLDESGAPTTEGVGVVQVGPSLTLDISGAAALETLIHHPAVVAVTPFETPSLHAGKARAVIGIPDRVAFGTSDLEMLGAGEKIAVVDFGFDAGVRSGGDPQVTVQPRAAGAWSKLSAGANSSGEDNEEGHGSHIVGCILIDGPQVEGLPLRGTAPKAAVLLQSIGVQDGGAEYPCAGVPDDITELLEQAREDDAWVHCNAWGASTAIGTTYSNWAAQLDAWCFANREAVVLFSAGNGGIGSVTCPGTAKNVLTVGASETNRLDVAERLPSPWAGDWKAFPPEDRSDSIIDTDDEPAEFSGGGPVAVRVKPEIAAPGVNILSYAPASSKKVKLEADTRFRFASGASQATAVASGVAASLRGWLLAVGFANPSSALVKAWFVATAKPVRLNQVSPDSQRGWGNLRIGDLSEQAARPDFMDAPECSIAELETHTYTIVPLVAANPVRVALAWTDAPDTKSAGGVVNHLQLKIASGAASRIGSVSHHTQLRELTVAAGGQLVVQVLSGSVSVHRPGLATMPDSLPRQDYALVVLNGRVVPNTDRAEWWASQRSKVTPW